MRKKGPVMLRTSGALCAEIAEANVISVFLCGLCALL